MARVRSTAYTPCGRSIMKMSSLLLTGSAMFGYEVLIQLPSENMERISMVSVTTPTTLGLTPKLQLYSQGGFRWLYREVHQCYSAPSDHSRPGLWRELMDGETKIKVSDPDGGVVLVNLHNDATHGKVVHLQDLNLIFPDAVGLSYSVGEITSICSISEDARFIIAPSEGWVSPVYGVIRKKKSSFQPKKTFSYQTWKQERPQTQGSSHAGPSRGRKKRTTCNISVGVMLFKKDHLSIVRRNSSLGWGTVNVEVSSDSSADDILDEARHRHLEEHDDMDDVEYTLLYPNRTRVNHIPGKRDLKFSPAAYIKHSTVLRLRDIRLYISPVADFEAYHTHMRGIAKPGSSGETKSVVHSQPKGIIKKDPKQKGIIGKEVSFAPHQVDDRGSDELEDTIEEVGTTNTGMLTDKYGTIDITYRYEKTSEYGKHLPVVILSMDRLQMAEAALQYEPSAVALPSVNPLLMGVTVEEVTKGEKMYLRRPDEDKAFEFPSAGDLSSNAFILHGPDVIHGCDRYGVLCGVVTKYHGAEDMSYVWHKNGKPYIRGHHLPIIPVTEAGDYTCIITKGDEVAISENFVYEDDKQSEKQAPAPTKQKKRMHDKQSEEQAPAPTKQKKRMPLVSKPSREEYQFRMISEEEIIFNRADVIGRGSFGVVYKGEWAGTPVAVKAISTRQLLQNPKRLLHEAQIHSSLNHPNILQLMGACIKKAQVLILTPYIHGSNLDTLIFSEEASGSKMDMDLKGYIAWQAASAVAYLHNLKPPVIHQDIKPANFILEDLTNNLRLMDLGLARLRNAVSTSQGGLVPCGGGTPIYSAPEVTIGGKAAQEPADVWGLACTILELVTEAPVWDGMQEEDCDNFLLPIMERKEKPRILGKLDGGFSFLIDCFQYGKDQRPHAMSLVGKLKSVFPQEKFLGYKL